MTVTNPNWIRVDSSSFDSPEEPAVLPLLLLLSCVSVCSLPHLPANE